MTAALAIVAIWSAAEAAIFFLVADIPISWIAIKSGIRAGLVAAATAAIASLGGALAVFAWAGQDATGATATMTALPGIDRALITDAAYLYHQGCWSMLQGSFTGVPFKLFALEAAQRSDAAFLLVAPLLRFPRYFAVALLLGGIGNALAPITTLRQRLIALSCAWILFYAFYFTVMPD